MSKRFFSEDHKCCCFFLIPPFLLLLFLFDMLLANVITPFRCDMWKGKEVEVFLTPEEWRKLSGVNESLKESEWIHYPAIEGKAEKDPFFIKNQGLYQPVMYFNGNRHWLSEVNSKYPYLNIYIYIQKQFLVIILLCYMISTLKRVWYSII